jgi:serine protease Do
MTPQTLRPDTIAEPRTSKHLIALLLFGTMPLIGVVRGDDSVTSSPNVSTASSAEDLQKLQTRVKKVLRDVLPAVVAVSSSAGPKTPTGELILGRGFASGVIIRADGLILSQYHVSHKGAYDDRTGLIKHGIPGDPVDVILHDGRQVVAELLGAYQLADLSLLKIREPGPYPFVPLADEDSVSLGDWVVKPGHPEGYRKSRGVVSRLGRVVYQNRVSIVADCMITGGDSGGPIINLDGKVVGIMNHSVLPDSVSLTAEAGRKNFLMAYSTVRKIREKMATMLASRVPRDTDFREHDERRQQFKEVLAMLPPDSWTNGEKVTRAWRELTSETRGSVIEVLDEQSRTAYGTVVGSDGWVLTKASEIGENPRCRLPDGEIVPSKITGVDAAFDLAMLKIEARELQPVQWSSEGTRTVGTFVVAPDIAGKPIAAGILSVPAHRLEGPFPKVVVRAPQPPPPRPIMPEILGDPIDEQGFTVSFSTGTAAKAGIRPGNVILEIDGRPIRTRRDLTNSMSGKSPGTRLRIVLTRDGQRVERTLTLEPHVYRSNTVRAVNFRYDKFPAVIEHDIALSPQECGGPVIALNGKALGITIARVGIHGCAAIPADAIMSLIDGLKSKGSRPDEP